MTNFIDIITYSLLNNAIANIVVFIKLLFKYVLYLFINETRYNSKYDENSTNEMITYISKHCSKSYESKIINGKQKNIGYCFSWKERFIAHIIISIDSESEKIIYDIIYYGNNPIIKEKKLDIPIIDENKIDIYIRGKWEAYEYSKVAFILPENYKLYSYQEKIISSIKECYNTKKNKILW